MIIHRRPLAGGGFSHRAACGGARAPQPTAEQRHHSRPRLFCLSDLPTRKRRTSQQNGVEKPAAPVSVYVLSLIHI
eukprot:555355-Alexandrium_andersonii.AAC.1